MHPPPWRAGLEDRALDTSGLGEMRSCHSRMERKDLCAAHTSVTSGSSAPLPGCCRREHEAGTCLARAPWADLSPSLPACSPALSSLQCPALTRVGVLVAWGPWPALLAARLWWKGCQDPCEVAEPCRDLGCFWVRLDPAIQQH